MADEPEIRPRKAGKSAARIEKIADAVGLKPDTVKDLIDAGWTLTFQSGEPSRWEQGKGRADMAKLAAGGLVSGVGPLVGDRPGLGFGPGPSLGAGAIQIHGIGDPNAIAHQVSEGLRETIQRVRRHQAELGQ